MEIASVNSEMMDYMSLLISELQNQNPMEPMDNYQMASQLAQFAQLQQSQEMTDNIKSMNSTMGEMNTSFQQAMQLVNANYAKSMVGKEITFYSEYYGQMLGGRAESVSFQNGQPTLQVKVKVVQPDGQQEEGYINVRPEDITSVKE